ncbi:MAG: hypothetical protein U0Z17_06985 [Bacteroidales bacterium]
MKAIVLLCLLLGFCFSCFAQPDEIKRIMAKQKSGEELTEQEETTFEKWIDDMAAKAANQKNPAGVASKTGVKKADCPILKTAPLKVTELTRESYVSLAKGLLTTYGPKTGDLPGLKSLLENSKKPTDGSNMAAMFTVVGAGSATVYATAWSATKKPDDLLTANNLG